MHKFEAARQTTPICSLVDTGTMAHKPLAPYGEGNSFPTEATNTDDWLDAIGLVRSAPLPSQNPIYETRVWCVPTGRVTARQLSRV